jgi:hypothetical protein
MLLHDSIQEKDHHQVSYKYREKKHLFKILIKQTHIIFALCTAVIFFRLNFVAKSNANFAIRLEFS